MTIIIFLFIALITYVLNFGKWDKYVRALTEQQIRDVLMYTVSPLVLLTVIGVCGLILIYIIYEIIKAQLNRKLFKGVSVQGNTIEIFEQSEESYFDKYLNEVLYLFENSGKDVIVFEDMDRYNSNQIFQRLREVNNLVNSRNSDKQLRFFYLLKDNIFVNKDRTKFFDFIMPIVPVLDGSNSYDQFIAHFKEGGILELFDEQFLQDISLYIDDMRILKNVYNEFLIYYNQIITTEQSPDKLLSIVIYKNIFPRDFSDLQLNKGYVYTLFDKKEDFIKDEVVRLNMKKDELRKKIEDAKNEHLKDEQEINKIYNPEISQIRSQGYWGDEKELKKLEQEKNERILNIRNKSDERQHQIMGDVSQIEKSIEKLHQKKLHEIINRENAEQIFKTTYTNEIGTEFNFNDIKGSDYFPLIKYLIRYGYIDETYPDYMTYFYEQSLSRTDKIFLRSITDENGLEYSYQIKNPELVLTRLSMASFNKEEILNFDLLSYLFGHGTRANQQRVKKVLFQIKDAKNFKFINLYFDSQKEIASFVRELNNLWPEAFKAIEAESNFTHERKKEYAIQSIYHTDSINLEKMDEEKSLSSFISKCSDFLNIKTPDIQRLIEVFELLNIRFEQINYEKSDKDLFREVYCHSFYVLSYELVCLMLNKVYDCSDEDALKHKNYTVVVSKREEALAKYVKDNMNEYLEQVLGHCDGMIFDSEEAIIEILNHSDLQTELRDGYIDTLKTTIEDIRLIEDSSIWENLLNHDIIEYSEKNVLQYFVNNDNGIDSTLAYYINRKGDKYDYSYNAIENEFGEGYGSKFYKAVVRSVELDIEPYSKILVSLNRHYTKFVIDGISYDKIRVLIRQNVISMTVENLLFMREKYPEAVIDFIKHNIEKYAEDVVSEECFDLDECLEILDTDIDDSYKFLILEHTDEPITVIGKAYSDEVKARILNNNFDVKDFPHLVKCYNELSDTIQMIVVKLAKANVNRIVEQQYFVPIELCCKLLTIESISEEVKLGLIAANMDNYDKIQWRECLTILENKKLLNALDGKWPTIPATSINKKILNIFDKKQWIAGYSLDKNKNIYRVRNKRLQKKKELPIEVL